MPELFTDPAVQAAFDGHAAPMRSALMTLRRLIFASAAEDANIGELSETLKWGEPAYAPKSPRVGTTVRVNALKASSSHYAAYFHCKTTLLDSFRLIYPEEFRFEGDRAMIFSVDEQIPEAPFKHCVALALTYHLRKAR